MKKLQNSTPIPTARACRFITTMSFTASTEAIRMADDVLRQGVQGISDIISDEAFINTDFADVRSVMTDSGIAHMGIGYGKGEKKVTDAVTTAIESPLLETTIGGAKKMLLYILGGMNFSMFEVKEITDAIRESAGDACDIIFGANINESLEDELYVTIIATGFDEGPENPTASGTRADVWGAGRSGRLFRPRRAGG